MFCNKCGNEVSSNQVFCNKCGNRLIYNNSNDIMQNNNLKNTSDNKKTNINNNTDYSFIVRKYDRLYDF